MSDPLSTAGEAASMLDQMGFRAIARRRDGVVTLETWTRKGKTLRVVVNDADVPPAELARACLVELDAPLPPRTVH